MFMVHICTKFDILSYNCSMVIAII